MSAKVSYGGDLSVASEAALLGSFGMKATINDTSAIYVRDDSPSNASHYRLRFYFDPNSLTMGNYDTHNILNGYSASSHILAIEFRMANGTYQVRTLTDAGTWRVSSYYTLSDAPHYLEFDWKAATSSGANDGYLTLWIDGVQKTSLTAIDNDTRRMESVRLGAVTGLDAATSGSYFFDAFESHIDEYIGP